MHHRLFHRGDDDDDNEDNQVIIEHLKLNKKPERNSFERRSQSLDRQARADNAGDKSDRKGHISRNIKAVVNVYMNFTIQK